MCYVFKELSFYQILKFSNPYIFATQCNRDLILQTMKSNNYSLKYQRFTPLGCKDIGLRKHELETKTLENMSLTVPLKFMYFQI